MREFLRDFIWVEVADEFIHEAADRRRYVVIHGDQFDDVESKAAWLSKLGSLGYDLLLAVDRSINYVRRRLGRKPWRLSAGVKARVKRIVSFLSGFEERLAEHARQKRCQGVICGHIHTPVIAARGEITYCNTGDWVENCSACWNSTTANCGWSGSARAPERSLTTVPAPCRRARREPAASRSHLHRREGTRMKRIFWGVMGEGLGHVTRTLAVIEHLPDCEVHIFTSGKAWRT